MQLSLLTFSPTVEFFLIFPSLPPPIYQNLNANSIAIFYLPEPYSFIVFSSLVFSLSLPETLCVQVALSSCLEWNDLNADIKCATWDIQTHDKSYINAQPMREKGESLTSLQAKMFEKEFPEKTHILVVESMWFFRNSPGSV